MIFYALIVTLFFLLPPTTPSAQAAEIFKFVDKTCNTTSGLVLNVSENQIALLTLGGDYKEIDKTEVQAVLIYRTLQNPIPKIGMSSSLGHYLKDIYLANRDEVSIRGWIVQFIDDLVVIYDTYGKTHVLEFNQIYKIRPSEMKLDSDLKLDSQSLNFTFGDYGYCNHGAPSVPAIPNPSNDIKPSRILVGSIRIDEFFSFFDDGFTKIQGFESRTYFYARPFVFEKSTRLGLVSLDSMEQPYRSFPFYVQWSTGEPYRFQSLTTLGGATTPVSTSLVNPFLIYSEVKSYFFHATFLGNLLALPAGNEFYTYISLDDKVKTKSYFASSFNYMALLGFDYEHYSISFGNFYPVFFINYKKQFVREVLANSVSPVFRFRYLDANWSASVLYSQTHNNVLNPTDDQISLDPNFSAVGQLSSFEFKSRFLRGDFDYFFSEKIKLTVGGLLQTGDYSETTLGQGNNSSRAENRVIYAMPEIDIGRYVACKATITWTNFQRSFNLANQTYQENDGQILLGGILEFIF